MATPLRALSAADLISIWEQSERQHPVHLAVELLRRALPQVETETLWQLPVGRREQLLLELREQTFGPRLHVGAACPSCREPLELELDTTELRAAVPVENQSTNGELRSADHVIHFRLPTSADQLSVARCRDREEALRVLLSRCVQAVRTDDGSQVTELPETTLQALAEKMAALDPQGETLFTLTCPACGEIWQAVIELSRVLLKELATEAERLIDEVHALAAAYGWDEEKIVAMSARKRRAYLMRCGVQI